MSAELALFPRQLSRLLEPANSGSLVEAPSAIDDCVMQAG